VEPIEVNTGKRPGLLVSVIIPTRNRADLLQNCLRSLLAQDIDPESYEIIVCDDGSMEDLAPVVAQFQPELPIIRLLRQPHRGPAAARNFGVLESRASIVLFLDSDVLPDKSIVSQLIEALNRNPSWAGAEAKIQPCEGEQTPLWDAPFSDNGGRFHTAAIAYRKEALMLAGGFDETFKESACEDVDLAAKILKYGPISFVREAVVYHPRRRVTLGMHWKWRKFWRYEMILAKRYGFLAFPGNPAGRFPRLRVALAAMVTLPFGRFIEGLKYISQKPHEGALACLYALFDIFCGLWALPAILFSRVPPRRNYLRNQKKSTSQYLNPFIIEEKEV